MLSIGYGTKQGRNAWHRHANKHKAGPNSLVTLPSLLITIGKQTYLVSHPEVLLRLAYLPVGYRSYFLHGSDKGLYIIELLLVHK